MSGISIYQHDINTDTKNPANSEGLNIVKCYCRTCHRERDIDEERKDCTECGDILVYIENDGREFNFDGQEYKKVD